MKKLVKAGIVYMVVGAINAWAYGVGAYSEMDLERAYPNKESMGEHVTIDKVLCGFVTWPWWLTKASYGALKRVYDFKYK